MQLPSEYIALGSLFIALGASALQYFGVISNIKERLTAVETKMELFWKPLTEYLTKTLHHPNTPKRDTFLENFDSLTLEELLDMKCEFKSDLEELQKLDMENPKVLLYTLLLSRIDQKIHDKMKKLCTSKSIVSRFLKVFK